MASRHTAPRAVRDHRARWLLLCVMLAAASGVAGCGSSPATPAAAPVPRHLVLVTIDTLRADRLGVYGHAAARTPVIDALAAAGARFDRAYSVAPITLTAHASLLSGRLPPAHGARHNGMTITANTPTLATVLGGAGFATGAFVAAFPLDRRFGLAAGFDRYGDRLPRGADGRLVNERAGQVVVDEALAWWTAQTAERRFVWVHLFEPHAPYGVAGTTPAEQRYDAEIAEADRQVGRLLDGLGAARADALVVVAADHGEAFGEHGEIGHSVFVYDTTLRIPLVMAGPGVAPRVVPEPVSLVDVLPTVLGRLQVTAPSGDGIDLNPVLRGETLPSRALYAESFAPWLDFGWSPLRSLREGGRKYIAAPRPELYDVATDAGETRDLSAALPAEARRLAAQVAVMAPATLSASATDPESTRRLHALGYLSSGPRATAAAPADPKDRRDLAAQLGAVTSGELQGPALETALRQILGSDPGNPQAELRLAVVLAGSNRCREAEGHFLAAIRRQVPSADAHLGLAGCLVQRRRIAEAEQALAQGNAVEPDNPVVLANQGLLLSDTGRPAQAVAPLTRAVALDPDFHQARFALAVALARDGQQMPAAAQTRELLTRLPGDAPQRGEVERLLKALQ